jgi:RecB family endonuclease NucS
MPVELGVWRIDGQLTRVPAIPLDLESRLEDILDREIGIANSEWMIVGRQVITPHGGRVDLLAIDRDGNLVILELKRSHMARDIVTQVLDYGSWISSLRAEEIAPIFNEYRKKRFHEEPSLSI